MVTTGKDERQGEGSLQGKMRGKGRDHYRER